MYPVIAQHLVNATLLTELHPAPTPICSPARACGVLKARPTLPTTLPLSPCLGHRLCPQSNTYLCSPAHACGVLEARHTLPDILPLSPCLTHPPCPRSHTYPCSPAHACGVGEVCAGQQPPHPGPACCRGSQQGIATIFRNRVSHHCCCSMGVESWPCTMRYADDIDTAWTLSRHGLVPGHDCLCVAVQETHLQWCHDRRERERQRV